MKFSVEHYTPDVSLARFEEVYFDEPFNEAMCRHVRLNRKLVERTEKSGSLYRVVEVGPEREIPKPVAKLLGAERIVYTEHLTYQLGAYHGTWKTVSSIMPDKVDAFGTFSFVQRDAGVVRKMEGQVDVKIFAVGKVIERFVVNDIEQSYQSASSFMNDHLRTNLI